MHTRPVYIYIYIYICLLKKKLKTLTINTKYPNPNPHFSFSINKFQLSPSPSLSLLLVTCCRCPPPSPCRRSLLHLNGPSSLCSLQRSSLPHRTATPPPCHRHRFFLFASLTALPLLHLATKTNPSSLPPSPHIDWKNEGFLLGFLGML